MATSTAPAEASITGRLRAKSQSIWEKVHRSPSRGSEGARGSVQDAIAQAGVVGGSVGSPLVNPDQQQLQDVRDGASVFLEEFERVVSRPTPKPGIERTGTIEVTTLAFTWMYRTLTVF